MEIRTLEKHQLAEAKLVWEDLENVVKPASVMNTWTWVETWVSVFGDMIPFQFVYGIMDDKPCGIVIVARETGRPFSLKNFYIGTAGEPYKDWIHMTNNDVLALPEYKSSFVTGIINHIKQTYSWEEITIEFLTDASIMPFIHSLATNKNKHRANMEPVSVLDLRSNIPTGKSVLDKLPSHIKRRINRCLRAFGDDVVAEHAETVEQALDILDELIVFHQSTWEKRGKRGMFSSERFTRFHKEIIHKLFDKGYISLFRIRSEKHGSIGCLYGFLERDTVIMYQSGFNDFSEVTFDETNNNRIKPGLITHALCIKSFAEKGFKEYNFGPGEYRYKAELSDSIQYLTTISLRNSIKPVIRDSMLKMYVNVDKNRHMKKLVKPMYAIYKQVS